MLVGVRFFIEEVIMLVKERKFGFLKHTVTTKSPPGMSCPPNLILIT
jgi:hypothetical protein